jgi:tetratricopeptide (TPR) repeat protein
VFATFRAFVGRQSETALLRDALKKAVTGQGALFMISGAHGVGKSSIVKQLARDARLLGVRYVFANERLVTGFDTTIAGTISDVIRTSVTRDESGKDLLLRWDSNPRGNIQQRETVFETMRIEQPVLLILEDIHGWSMEALASLRFLERVVDEAGVLAVATYCEGEIRRDPIKRLLFKDLTHFAIDMTLGDLDESATCELVEALAGCPLESSVVRAIFRATGGSPLFIEHVLQHCSNPKSFRMEDRFFARLSISLPARDVLMSCLSELSPSSREVLNAAAVLGNEFALDVLASICALEGRELLNSLDEAREAGLLERHREHKGGYRFRRSLMRQLLYRELSSFRRTELHRRAADAIEALHGVAFNAAGEIAKHLQEGSDENECNTDWSNDCTDDATVQQTETHLDFLVRLGESQARAGLYKAALTTLARAGAAAERLGDAVRLARIALAMPSHLVPLPGAQNPAAALLARSALSRDHTLEARVRAQLFARLAAENSHVPEAFDRAQGLMVEALEMANGCGAEVQLRLLTYRDLLLRGPRALDQRMDNARAIDELAARVGDRAASHFGFVARATAHLERGEIALAEFAWSEAATAAGFAPGPGELVSISLSRASRAFVEGRLEEARTILQELLEDDAGSAQFDIGEAMRALVCREQGAFPDAHDAAWKAVERRPSCATYRALLALIDLDLGGQGDARSHFERLSGDRYRHLPSDGLFLACGALLADLCAGLGDLKRADVLYSLLVPYASHFAVMGHGLMLGPISLPLGILAISLGRFEAARQHLEEALAMNRSAGVRPWTGYANYHLARCLARDGGSLRGMRPGQAALQEALAEAEALGMTRLLERARLLRDTELTQLTPAELSTKSEVPKGDKAPQEVKDMAIASGDAKAETVQFCEEDETCVLGFGSRKVRMRRSKGLELMMLLLREPGREFHVLDIGQANDRNRHGDEATQPTDGGPLLDASAKQAYRLRLQGLREEREEAQRFNDLQRVSRIEEEINFLARELARAIGLKGADRKPFSDAERARVRVTQAIRSTIRKISKHDSVLGWHLEKAVKTGSFCCYHPAPF